MFFRLFDDFLAYMSDGGASTSMQYDPSRSAKVTHGVCLVGMHKIFMGKRKYSNGNQVREALARSRASADPTKVGKCSVL
jgi:hypothetical protein